MVSCRRGGWGPEGWASQLGFPVCGSRSGRVAPGVGRRPLPPGCWLAPTAGDPASPCLRRCSPALGATSSGRAPGGPPPSDRPIPAPAALGLRRGQVGVGHSHRVLPDGGSQLLGCSVGEARGLARRRASPHAGFPVGPAGAGHPPPGGLCREGSLEF